MPTIQFKGKSQVKSHHVTVSYHDLIPNKELSITENVVLNNDNLIIQGDNLKALKALLPTYAGKIDCIYIDPPYNTGNEHWVYNDNVNSPMIQEWLGKVVDKEDLCRHDKWLCMMMPRLNLLKELLHDEGVIFISIDYNEEHHLKSLMNEIFGEENYRDSIVIRRGVKNVQAQFETIDSLSSGYESILVYTKNPERRFNKVYAELEDVQDGGWNNHWRGTDRPTMRYELFGIKPETGQWRWGETRSIEAKENYEKLVKEFSENDIELSQENIDSWYLKYVEETGDEIDLLRLSVNGKPEHYIPPTDKKLLSNLWYDLKPNGQNQLKAIFGKKVFDTPKSTDLIKRLIKFAVMKDEALILDSFAGSGSTGQAVLEYNQEEGTKHKFILIEMEDYVKELTTERIRRVIKGVPNAKSKVLKDGLGGTFSYFELGEAIEFDKILSGENLPSYESLARYLFYIATGEEFKPEVVNVENNFIGSTSKYDVFLFYKPDLDYLKSTSLNIDKADQIASFKPNRNRIVFAPMKFLDEEYLEKYKIRFAKLPYEIYSIKD
ncbi:site-specific DNA-methyltransferase [Bacillus cereus group sp. TH217LC]|uniref:site-specific DNA-methyltransferase n=1 Tax=Bacillus cereus group TaxID=86661 RepID=UPI000943FEB3|nr:site-specific DNA-methyltransferase [Bacillus cereus group sp. TH217LC]MDA1598131.1 site-specific DNA-methyltransferase [Bacillus cereus group sp. TH217LC]